MGKPNKESSTKIGAGEYKGYGLNVVLPCRSYGLMLWMPDAESLVLTVPALGNMYQRLDKNNNNNNNNNNICTRLTV